MPKQKKYAQCDNCGEQYDKDDLKSLAEIHHLAERLSPGEPCPAGECPAEECGALCFVVKADGETPGLLEAAKNAENWLRDYVPATDAGIIGLMAEIRAAIREAEEKS